MSGLQLRRKLVLELRTRYTLVLCAKWYPYKEAVDPHADTQQCNGKIAWSFLEDD